MLLLARCMFLPAQPGGSRCVHLCGEAAFVCNRDDDSVGIAGVDAGDLLLGAAAELLIVAQPGGALGSQPVKANACVCASTQQTTKPALAKRISNHRSPPCAPAERPACRPAPAPATPQASGSLRAGVGGRPEACGPMLVRHAWEGQRVAGTTAGCGGCNNTRHQSNHGHPSTSTKLWRPRMLTPNHKLVPSIQLILIPVKPCRQQAQFAGILVLNVHVHQRPAGRGGEEGSGRCRLWSVVPLSPTGWHGSCSQTASRG